MSAMATQLAGVSFLAWPFVQRDVERDGVPNHQPHDCLLKRLFNAQIKEKNQSSTSLAFVRKIHRDRWFALTKGQ